MRFYKTIPSELTILKAKLVTNDVETFAFRNVVTYFTTPNRILKNSLFLEDSVANVGEAGFLYVSPGNLSSNCQRVKNGTLLDTAVPIFLVHGAIPSLLTRMRIQ